MPSTDSNTPRRSFAHLWRDAIATSSESSADRRYRVLQHDDLRAQLMDRPFGITDPDRWNGWIPPRLDQHGNLNTSPVRRQLVEIAAEAMRREQAATIAADVEAAA